MSLASELCPEDSEGNGPSGAPFLLTLKLSLKGVVGLATLTVTGLVVDDMKVESPDLSPAWTASGGGPCGGSFGGWLMLAL